MKVPNKILDTVEVMCEAGSTGTLPTEAEVEAVRKWVREGKAKRAALAAEAKVGGVSSEGAP